MLKMASAFLMMLSILIPFSLFISCSSQSQDRCGGISVIWGTNSSEGDLIDACNSGLYQYVSIAYLSTFGHGSTPALNLSDHCLTGSCTCDPGQSGSCTRFGPQIRACQEQGIKVLLSIGGPDGNYGISSQEDASQVADYLWNTYLRRNSTGPLGQVALDGINFDIENPGSTSYWSDLASALAAYKRQRNFYVALTTQCPIPDPNFDTAITTGLFDHVYVEFYDNGMCDSRTPIASFLETWRNWTTFFQSGELFLGMSANPRTAGYYPPDRLVHDILPIIRTYREYGGVMVWNRYYDLNNSYTAAISPAACPTINHEELLIKQVTFE